MILRDTEELEKILEKDIKHFNSIETNCNTDTAACVMTIRMHEMCLDAIRNVAPIVEAKPVVHAHWEQIRETKKFWANTHWLTIEEPMKTQCSHCKATNKQYKPPYCPHCGAKMDEGEQDNEI